MSWRVVIICWINSVSSFQETFCCQQTFSSLNIKRIRKFPKPHRYPYNCHTVKKCYLINGWMCARVCVCVCISPWLFSFKIWIVTYSSSKFVIIVVICVTKCAWDHHSLTSFPVWKEINVYLFTLHIAFALNEHIVNLTENEKYKRTISKSWNEPHILIRGLIQPRSRNVKFFVRLISQTLYFGFSFIVPVDCLYEGNSAVTALYAIYCFISSHVHEYSFSLFV